MNNETKITKKKYEALGEELIRIDHKSGLTALVVPKRGFSKKYAVFATNYGSIDREFGSEHTNGMITVPDGIAHFLEHKLFEGKDGNAFEKYAVTGAQANAYTSFDKTAYLFSCTDRFKENLNILLDFVQSPYFTDENVQKEQGIIGQEIRMYDDHPDFRVLYNLLNLLYVEHPVRVDIAGTVESISHITPEILNTCYDTFYDLSNMVLCIAGDVSIDDVISAMDEKLIPKRALNIERKKVSEPEGIAGDYTEQPLEVAIPKFQLGFKDICGVFTGREAQKNDHITEILLEMIAGEDTGLYSDLFGRGLINRSFGSEYYRERSFALSIFEGESEDPKSVRDAIFERIEELCADFDEDAFNIAKKNVYSRMIFQFNSTDNIANSLISCYFNDIDMFEGAELIRSISKEEAKERLVTHFRKELAALSVICPANGKQS
ncbi:MAG: insulinase family protein [Clostridia bacterium]|nr:insulinase family protein [Clostridia bacterium]